MNVGDVEQGEWQPVVLQSPQPVLVDVWAPWCLPCKRVEPMMAQVAERYSGQLVCLRLNADDAPDLVAEYELLSLPTLLIFRDGVEAGRLVGLPKLDSLVALVESNL